MKFNYSLIFSTLLLTTSAFSQVTTPKESLFYEISGKGLEKPSYLFGTIHIYDPNIVQIPQKVFECLDKTSALVLEVSSEDMENGAEKLVKNFMLSDKDSSLSALLSEKAYENLRSFPKVKMIGSQLNKFVPLFAYQVIFFNSGWKSVETILTEHAELRKKKEIGLESLEEQVEAIKSIPIRDQITELEYWLTKDNPEVTMVQLMQSMFKAYAQQSIGDFFENMEHTHSLINSSPQLVSERDLTMTDRIEKLLVTSDNFFVAVGALHLQNKTENGGIVNILRKKGYTVTPIIVDLAKSEQ